ncbi:MAG: GNAT family N-acetyltransferase [Myxococcota bacterium]
MIPAGGLAGLYTDPAFRRRGIASALLERACDAMRGRGLELAGRPGRAAIRRSSKEAWLLGLGQVNGRPAT